MVRSHREIWELLELDYFRRLPPFRAIKRWMSAAMFMLAVAWVALSALRKDETLYSSGPMSIGHAQLADDCAECHTQTFRRFQFVDDERKSLAMNASCLTCHGATIGHAADVMTALHEPASPPGSDRNTRQLACSSCHIEHDGHKRLIDMSDHHCVQCHSNLATNASLPEGASIRVDRTVSVFTGNADDPGVHPDFRIFEEGGTDNAAIRFNHHRHLVPEAYDETEGLLGPDGHVHLRCDDCHRIFESRRPWRFASPNAPSRRHGMGLTRDSDDGDRYMSPIDFETHCAACHPLTAGDREDQLAGDDRTPQGQVPHRAPTSIRTYLRGQLTAYLTGALRSGQTMAPSKQRTPLPVLEPRSGDAAERLKLDWVEQEIVLIERRLYERENGGCRKCHEITGESTPTVAIVPTEIPHQWLLRGTFHHEKHQALPEPIQPDGVNCNACHSEALDSKETSDILLPRIDKCRECHAPAARVDGRTRGGTSYGCVFCHEYHRPPMALTDLKGTVASRP